MSVGQGWPEGVGRKVFDTLDSTNAEAARRVAAGAPDTPCWFLAQEQTLGRGRRGRAWATPRGNFSATLLMRPEGQPAEAALRSFVAALALREALVAATGREDAFALKWPNDVLLQGRKLAGILLESGGHGYLMVGIGVNLAVAPEAATLEAGALPPVALKGALGTQIAPEAFLDLLAPAFARLNDQLATQGFAPIRNLWLAHAARLGTEITARLPGREIKGIFETVDATGALVLQTPQGRVNLPAGDVFFVPSEG